MMKSYATYLQGLYGAIISDIALQFPSLRVDLERDLSRLHSILEARGLPFFTIDLPELGKHLDMCLASKCLTHSGIAYCRPYKKGVIIPRLFKGLWRRIFDDNGALRVNPDTTSIRFLRQLLYASKKLRMECSDVRVFKEVSNFFRIEQEARTPSLNWDADELIRGVQAVDFLDAFTPHDLPRLPLDDFHPLESDEACRHRNRGAAVHIQSVCDLVSATIGRFDPSEWRTKHGPGAVSDSKFGISKYEFPYWPEKLARVFPLESFAFANYSLWADAHIDDEIHGRFSVHEPPAKLIAVPKTQKAPRLIASEPTAHQWCQQSVRHFLVESLSKTPICQAVHFRDQSQNQEFARTASLVQTHATVDLSSASDRLTCWTVERLFRKNNSLLDALHASRTRWMVNTIDRKSPKYIKLKKFACQGSACTFPVQSILYACIAIGSILFERGLSVNIKNTRAISQEVRVFGDDVVIPLDGWDLYQEMLGHFGFEVNRKKTYGTGKFRESCGLDAYDGTEVTPTYSMTYPEKTRPESIISCIESSNNFERNCMPLTAAWMESIVSRVSRYAIPYLAIGSGKFGWKRHFVPANDHLKRRWNADLQRVELLIHSPKGKVSRHPDRTGSRILQYFTEAPRPDTNWESGVPGRPTTKLRRGWESLASIL